jgi:sulfatase modifying factor 1
LKTKTRLRFERLTLAAVSGTLLCSRASALITPEVVPVGDPGNPADPVTGYGAVGYHYAIGRYEVTLNQYAVFLNAVAAADPYSLYNPSMSGNPNIAGIQRNGSPGSYTYSVLGSGDRPVTYVSWFDAARFVNWLHNGQPSGAEDPSTTEDGAYTLNGALSGVGFTKNPGAQYWIPSENEWYKAAYYQPAAQGGDSDGYWLYPTRSNTQPNSRNGSNTDPNSANFFSDDGTPDGVNDGYAVTGSPAPPSGNALTDVGAFSLAQSFYGTFDQGGNVEEWNDAVKSIGNERGVRGGSWFWSDSPMRADREHRNDGGEYPQFETFDLGFRIATVPEPGTVGILTVGMVLFCGSRRRRI